MVISKKKRFSLEFSLIFFNFCPKARRYLKKRSSPKFRNYFLQLIIVTALKFLTLPKFFISLPEKFWFCPNIFLSLLEKFQFCPNLRNLGSNFPPFFPAAMCEIISTYPSTDRLASLVGTILFHFDMVAIVGQIFFTYLARQ